MRTRPLGESGIDASVIALGTWAMGGSMWGGADDAASVRAIHAALDLGMNFLDTAPIYGFGHSEQIVGKALKDRRDRAVIATKCGMVCNTRQGRPMFRSTAQGPSEHGHIEVFVFNGPESIRREVEGSLARLQTDRIDLYQTHWQDDQPGGTPYEDTMDTLLRLRQEGKIRAIGVCNSSPGIMDRYRSRGRLDSDQEKYSMLDRKIEAEQLPYCAKHSVAVLAYSPLALGLLTGRVGPDRQFRDGDMRRTHRRFTPEVRARIASLLQRFEPLTKAHRCSMGQLVLAWTLAQPGVTHALVGARDESQVLENAAAAKVVLPPTDIAAMTTSVRELTVGIP